MRAVITVIGKDTVGILAAVAAKCSEHQGNVTEVTQSVLQDLFAMIMVVDIHRLNVPFTQFAEEMEQLGAEKHLVIHAMHEDIFNAMHTI
jgi:ACT domain-containing protein